MPTENQHACDLKDAAGFQQDSFRMMQRKHEGKSYNVRIGKLKGEEETTEQAYLYPKSAWSASQARSHCASYDGKFAAATGSSASVRQAERCAAQHFGPWMVEPYWFVQAVAAVKAGTFVPAMQTSQMELYEVDSTGIAQIGIYGQMTKGASSFGGTSSVRTRRALREAANDDSVKAILLHVDSPGGTVAGTAELAADVAGADRRKPVHAYIEDVGASAAYWVASQARRITANTMAQIGSIGTVVLLVDSSGQAEKAGVIVHVVATGAYKGAFAPGTEITEEQLEYARGLVESLNVHLLQGIEQGRHMPAERVRELADGRMYPAAKALELGLIDGIESLDTTVENIRKTVVVQDRQQGMRQRLRLAAMTNFSLEKNNDDRTTASRTGQGA